MLSAIAASLGLTITTIGETRLPDMSIRPDFAVDVAGARVGYVELKKPGHGVPENWEAPSQHDRTQWERFKLLPNVLYADGEQLYENFLTTYDPALRRKSGVYYTPAPLVSFTTRFVDDVLRTRHRRNLGFAERDVIVVDPAMGTGSFLAEVVNTVAATAWHRFVVQTSAQPLGMAEQ